MSHRIAGLVFATTLIWGCASSELGQTPTPHSLHSTVPDGALRAQADGHFVADEDAIRLFDYFLTTEGEVAEEQLHAMVRAEIARQLVEPARSQAEAAFVEYITYREEAAALLQGSDVAAAQAELTALHARTVARLPGLAADLPRIERAFAIHAALTAKSANAASTRPRTIAHLWHAIAGMAPSADARADAAALEPSQRVSYVRDETERLRQSGAGSEAIRALRVAEFGAGAAARLESLDAERAAWQRRLDAYRAERAAILASIADLPARERALSALVDSRFDAREALRVRALERTGQLD